MKVINTIKPLEIDGKDSNNVGEKRLLSVESHWNMKDRIHLKFEGVDITVPADELERAINNARNHRY